MKAKINYTCANGTKLEIIGKVFIYPNEISIHTIPNSYLMYDVKEGNYINIFGKEENKIAAYTLPYNNENITITKLNQEADITYDVKVIL